MEIIEQTNGKNEQKLMCSNCGKSIPLSDMTMYNGSLLCRDCNSNRKAKEVVVIPKPVPANIPAPSTLDEYDEDDEDSFISKDLKNIAKLFVVMLMIGLIIEYVCSNL